MKKTISAYIVVVGGCGVVVLSQRASCKISLLSCCTTTVLLLVLNLKLKLVLLWLLCVVVCVCVVVADVCVEYV